MLIQIDKDNFPMVSCLNCGQYYTEDLFGEFDCDNTKCPNQFLWKKGFKIAEDSEENNE